MCAFQWCLKVKSKQIWRWLLWPCKGPTLAPIGAHGPLWATWAHIGPHGPHGLIRAFMGPYRSTRAHGPHGPIWAHMGPRTTTTTTTTTTKHRKLTTRCLHSSGIPAHPGPLLGQIQPKSSPTCAIFGLISTIVVLLYSPMSFQSVMGASAGPRRTYNIYIYDLSMSVSIYNYMHICFFCFFSLRIRSGKQVT